MNVQNTGIIMYSSDFRAIGILIISWGECKMDSHSGIQSGNFLQNKAH